MSADLPPHEGDGRSLATAIFFTGLHGYEEHIGLQYAWLGANALQSQGQTLVADGGARFDVHDTAAGRIWFRLPDPSLEELGKALDRLLDYESDFS